MLWYKRMSINWFELRLKKNPGLVWSCSLAIGGLLYLKVWLPATHIGVPCICHELTGLYCPGCGITRAITSLFTFDLYQSFRFNPLLYVLFPLYLAYTIIQRKKIKRLSDSIMAVMLTATIAFGLLRNIPAFDWLAPTIVR